MTGQNASKQANNGVFTFKFTSISFLFLPVPQSPYGRWTSAQRTAMPHPHLAVFTWTLPLTVKGNVAVRVGLMDLIRRVWST
ncbi:hypothetical protein BGY98DRAFT_1180298 [Russula aff. rugulosa BPL654]|nr:hypothetical protein BGY98DRAFT_1180298 [Russula aff. rugulosa BPL654]